MPPMNASPPFTKIYNANFSDVARKTFFYDCLRGMFAGITDTGPRTFFLLIAVKHFGAADLFKSLISIPGHLGMIFSVVAVVWLNRSRLPKTTLAAMGRMVSGFCFLLSAFQGDIKAYTFWIMLATVVSPLTLPLMTSVYHENYPKSARGKLFAWGSMLNILSSALFHWLIGIFLTKDLANYPFVLVGFSVASFLTAWVLYRIPASPGGLPTAQTGFFSAFRWVIKDKLFAYMLLIWFIFGFANLMTIPLRVIYLTDSKYGLVYSAALVALVVGIVPDITRLLFTPVWAHFFDKYNFMGIRMWLNGFLALYTITFFHSRELAFLCLASFFDGVFSAGGNIAWNLWVTQFAPPGHTSEYMSVHQFFTGVRGVIGAFLGISLATHYGVGNVAWISLGLVVITIVMLAPIVKYGRSRESALTAQVENPEGTAGVPS